MSVKDTISRFLSKNSYLLILAAWLVTLSFIIDNYWSTNASITAVQKRMNSLVHKAEADFLEVINAYRKNDIAGKKNVGERLATNQLKKDYYIFLYEQDVYSNSLKLKFWNTQNVLPDSGIIRSPLKAGFTQLPNGFYVWNKIESGGVFAVALIPIKWNYIINNEYLKNNFVDNSLTGQQFDIFPGAALKGNVSSLNGNPLFYLLEKPATGFNKDNIISVWFRIIAAILVLLFIHLYAVYYATHKRLLHAIGFLLLSIVVLRVISYVLPVPLNFRQIELFDPTIYGSNFILKSLGDLLINALLFVWIVLFIRNQLKKKNYLLNIIDEPWYKWGVLSVGVIILLSATFITVNITRSLIADSQISFDVINFFSLNWYSVVGFVVLCCMAVGYYILSRLIIELLQPLFPGNFKELYLFTSIGGLIYLSFKIGRLQDGLELFSLIWLLLFLLLLNRFNLNKIKLRFISTQFVFWIFFFTFFMTALIITENNKKELRKRYHYAETLASKTDPVSESMLSAMLTNFRLEFLSDNFSRLKNEKTNKYLKDSLISNNFSGFSNRFETRIYSFDEQENALFNADNTGFNQLNTILNTQAKATSVAGLYYYDESYDHFSYISKKNINDFNGNPLGTVFILVSPKMVRNEMLYPELFSKGSNTAIENSAIYAFAIYDKKKLVNSYSDYPFSTKLPLINFAGNAYYQVHTRDYDELWYNAGADKYIVIVKENRWFLESVTLFSYLFCSFLLLSAFFWILNILVSARLNLQLINNYWQLNIRNQIHGIIIFISALSFIIIGITTILFFISRYESNNKEKLSRVIQIMKHQMPPTVSETWQLNDFVLAIEKGTSLREQHNIINIAEIHGVDVNLYDLNGNLKLASLPLPYVKGIVSTKMEPNAYYHMNKLKQVNYFHQETIGNLAFVSSYVPVFDTRGNAVAYLNIPYYTSEKKLQQEIANFLVTIINLNAFIFLIAGIVALFITNRITHSFSLIAEKMKDINLGKINEAIEWKRNDEIGVLVKEYNKMLAKLDASAAALAKTEREEAWREMAKQVAHEIKNPLTPMKLSLQFLQRSIYNNAPNVKELTGNVANTLVEQIDHLSNIANEFSQFANIENANKEKIDLNDALLSIRQLYEGNEQITIDWDLLDLPVYVFADKTHINRMFTNLILNAIQSVANTKMPQLKVDQSIQNGSVHLMIKDNGEGIPHEIQSQIFTPNFTTKSSGTGLGLAICKRMVEQMNGKIWFETSIDEGTAFFIEIPLYRN